MNLTRKQIKTIIENEIIVDCYGEEEQITGWATYLDDYLIYPFTAEYQVEKTNGTSQWQTVNVRDRDSSGVNYEGRHYYVKIELGEFVLSVKLSDLRNAKTDEEETQIAMQVYQYRHKY